MSGRCAGRDRRRNAITMTGATLHGSVDANGTSTTVSFAYGPGFATTIAATPATVTTNGATVSAAITGLTCGTLYQFRVHADNGTAVDSASLTFTTSACPAGAPAATAAAADAISMTGATLHGSVDANGTSTTVSFAYGPGFAQTIAATPATVTTNGVAVSAAITGLTCGTLYQFRVHADNGTAVDSASLTFTTSACPAGAPAATAAAADAISMTGATLHGSVDANGTSTTVSFAYGPGFAQTIAATPATVTTNGVAVSAAITGLTCGTLYQFRVHADNGTAVDSASLTFTTSACPAGAPAATAAAADAISMTGATLHGSVDANGASTTVSFAYGPGFAQTIAATPATVTTNGVAVSAAITGLTCGTLYQFRVHADNGTAVDSASLTFTTSACPAGAPSATTAAASAIAASGATLNGTVSANGASTMVTFEYGTGFGYGSTVNAAPNTVTTNGVAVNAAITGLTCNTLYHFRVDANNGTAANGNDATFTTSACPSVTTYSAMTYTGTGFASVVLSGGGASCTLSNLAFVGPPTAPPAGFTFPDGLFQFSANNCVGTITVTVTFPTAFSGGEQYYKYGPTSGQLSPHWYTLGAGNSLTLVGNVATFTIADGGLGDDDLSINGTIVDQGGPAAPAPVALGTPEPAPALNIWSLLALAGLLTSFGIAQTRRRRVISARSSKV